MLKQFRFEHIKKEFKILYYYYYYYFPIKDSFLIYG